MGYDTKQMFLFFSADTPWSRNGFFLWPAKNSRTASEPDCKIYIPMPASRKRDSRKGSEVLRLLS
jgi:hypothetical protein